MKPPPIPALREVDRALVLDLAGRLSHRRTVDVIGGFYTAPEVQQQLGDRDSRTCERLAYMSGLVVAEVSMRRAALVAA